jgi:hypothetical protein
MVDDVDLCTCKSVINNSIFQAFIYVKEKENPIIKECLVSLLKNKHKYSWRINGIEPTIDMYNVMTNIGIDVRVGTFDFNNFKFRFLEEYTPIDDVTNIYRFIDCYVRLNNLNVMKSRDVDYLKAKMEKIVWQ